MNTLLKKIIAVSLVAAGAPAVWGEPAKPPPAKPAPARSVFVIPTNVREGRDPFFPESPRPYDDFKQQSRAVEENAFSVKGISIEHGHPMAIINNHTFAVGDEGNVRTANGEVHLRCTEIRNGVVVIEVNGAKRELTITTK